MQGKDFAQEYNKLKDQEEYLSFCIDVLSGVEESERTEIAIKAIEETREKVRTKINKLDSFEVVKKIV